MLKFPYKCKSCDASFEEWYKSGEAPQETSCEACGGEAKRVWGFATAKTDSYLMGNAWAKKHEQQAKKEMRHIDPNE